MRRRYLGLASDVLALTLGFIVALSLTTKVFAARRAEPGGRTSQTLSLFAPTDGQIVTGTVTVSALASPETDMLQFQVGGSNLGPLISSGSCTMSWNTASTADGAYSVSVTGYDDNGVAVSSAPVTVTVENTAPQISGVAANGLTSSSAVITWSTNQRSSSGADYGLSGYSSSAPLDSRLVTQHALTITGLSPGTIYHFRVASTNDVGLTGTSADTTFTTAGASESMPSGGSGGSDDPGGSGGSGDGSGGGLGTTPPSSKLPSPPPSPPPSSPPPPTPPPSDPAATPPITKMPAPPSNTIEGTLLGSDGAPLVGVKVFLLRGASALLISTTDSAGQFRFSGVEPGSYTALAVTPDGAWLRFFYTIPVPGS